MNQVRCEYNGSVGIVYTIGCLEYAIVTAGLKVEALLVQRSISTVLIDLKGVR